MAAFCHRFVGRMSPVFCNVGPLKTATANQNFISCTFTRSTSCSGRHHNVSGCSLQHCTSQRASSQKDLLRSSPLRHLHTSARANGLEEFFGDPKLWHEAEIKSGRAWSVEDLRLKDNETIHKLWYVLLKEKNMLLTMEAEADRQEKYMPGEDRMGKVEESMENIREVIKERDEALNELQLGRKEKHPGRWDYTAFGFMHYVKPKEHLVPKHMSRAWATERRQYDPYMNKYIKLWLEKVKKDRWRRARVAYKQEQKTRQRFPDSDMWEEDNGKET